MKTDRMRIHVLGAAAGGGFPQWNCGCTNCCGVRRGSINAAPLTQASVAVSTDDEAWFLIHASPDIRTQLMAFPPLHPRTLRGSPIAGIFLTNADLDQTLGLLILRESQPLHVYATETVRQAFMSGNRLYRALSRMPDHVMWHELKLGSSQRLFLLDGSPSPLTVTAVPMPGKVPLFLEGTVNYQPEDNIALLFQEERKQGTFAYAPSVAGRSSAVDSVLRTADCLFFDGTFWTDDELVRLGIGTRTARDMAHWPLDGTDGSLEVLTKAKAVTRVLIHINNTNPILRADSPQRRQVNEAGIDVAYDGLEVLL
jgi:pyrroloquinoline quinone biosynthesis protein B